MAGQHIILLFSGHELHAKPVLVIDSETGLCFAVPGKIEGNIGGLVRQELERRQLAAWEAGQNPSVGRTYSLLMQEINNPAIIAPEQGNVKNAITPPVISPKPVARISWVSEKARNLWQGRIESIRVMLEDMTVYAAVPGTNKCTVRRVPAASFERLFNLSNKIGIGATTLPDDALPGAICTEPGVPSGIFMAGDPSAIASAEAAWATGDLASLYAPA